MWLADSIEVTTQPTVVPVSDIEDMWFCVE